LAFFDFSSCHLRSALAGFGVPRRNQFWPFTCVHHAFTKEKNRERFRKNGFATLNRLLANAFGVKGLPPSPRLRRAKESLKGKTANYGSDL
jgi:hypothetical protein